MSIFIFNSKDDDITLFLVGDSTLSEKPFVAGGNPEKGWGQILPLYFQKMIEIENHAVNGRSTKSYRDQGRWDQVLSLMKEGDYVLIEFGHNDQKIEDSTRYADPDIAYRANLKKYVRDARSKGVFPILATPVVRRRFDTQGEFYDTHGKYPEVVREVAKSEGVALLDLHKKSRQLVEIYGEERSKQLFLHIAAGEYPSLPDGRTDDTHLSALGAFRICDLAVEELTLQLPILTKYLKK